MGLLNHSLIKIFEIEHINSFTGVKQLLNYYYITVKLLVLIYHVFMTPALAIPL